MCPEMLTLNEQPSSEPESRVSWRRARMVENLGSQVPWTSAMVTEGELFLDN